MSRMFQDFALLTMEEWADTTLGDLKGDYGLNFGTDLGVISGLQKCDISNSTLAIRHTRLLNGNVTLHELFVFVWEADGAGPGILERHYRIRAEEAL